jgi:hypothetical protein
MILININSQKVKKALEEQAERLKESRDKSNETLTSRGGSSHPRYQQIIDETEEYYEAALLIIKNKIKACEMSETVLVSSDEIANLFPKE